MTREELRDYVETQRSLNNIPYHVYTTLIDGIDTLEQELRIGHWVEHHTPHSTYYDCSLCGCVAPCTEFADSFLWKLSNFCPDCGADMREVEE